MIPLPSFLASPLRLIGAIIGLIALGVGIVYGFQWNQDRINRNAVNAVPEIAAARVLVVARKQDVTAKKVAYRGAVTDFNAELTRARADPNTPASTTACLEKGLAVISKCDALQLSYDSLVRAQDTLAQKLTDEAVRARRGKLVALTAALGWNPIEGAPAGRLGAALNFADHWSAIGTYDQAARIRRDTAGRIRTAFTPTAFIGLEYHFGGRR